MLNHLVMVLRKLGIVALKRSGIKGSSSGIIVLQ